MNKKIFFVLATIVFLVFSVTFVSAFSLVDFFKGFFGKGGITGNPIYGEYAGGPLSVYQFQENSYSGAVGEVKDSVGNMHGTTFGGVLIGNDGIDGKSAKFDGVNDQINFGNSDIFNPYSNSVTYSFWFKKNGTLGNYRNIFYKRGTFSWWSFISFPGETMLFEIRNNGTYADNLNLGVVPNDVWTHYVVTLNRQTGSFVGYRNGVVMQSKTIAFTQPINNTAPVLVGSTSTANHAIDEVLIFNRSLRSDAVYELYLNQSSRLVSGDIKINPVNGECGTTINKCTGGVFEDRVDSSTHYLWACLGIEGGANAQCSLAKDSGNQTNQTLCYDSDGGLNYYVKGNTFGISVFPDEGQTTKTDYCIQKSSDGSFKLNYSLRDPYLAGKVQTCVENSGDIFKNCVVQEYYCSANDVIVSDAVDCPNGCYDGACIVANQTCKESFIDFVVEGNNKIYMPVRTNEGEFTLPYLWGYSGKYYGLGDFDDRIAYSSMNSIDLSESRNNHFVVSYSLESYSETYAFILSDIREEDGGIKNVTTIRNLATGASYYFTNNNDDLYIGELKIKITNQNGDAGTSTLTVTNNLGNTNGVYLNRLYDANGNYIIFGGVFPSEGYGIGVFNSQDKLIKKYWAYWENGVAKIELVEDNCLESAQICSEALNLIKEPKDIFISQEANWTLNYNYSWEDKDSLEAHYSASWNMNNWDQYNAEYGHVWTEVSRFSNKERLEYSMNNLVEQGLCQVSSVNVDYETGTYKNVYVCKNIWNMAYDNQKVLVSDSYNYENNIEVIWFNDNLLFRMEFSNSNYFGCYDSFSCQERDNYIRKVQQQDLISVADSLINNKAKFESISLDYRSRQFISEFLKNCDSQVKSVDGYQEGWYCKREPVICPEYGTQKETCTSYNDGLERYEMREATISCSPGICSGCYVPRWFGYNNGDNVCIPYGTRLAQKSVESEFEIIWENVDGGEGFEYYRLDVIDENSAELIIFGDYYNNSYYLKEGNLVNVYLPNSGEESSFEVKEIGFDNGKGYIKISGISAFDAYCNYDGEIYEQKYGESSCQNNYECDSNLCSSGKCVQVQQILDESKGFRNFVVRLLCTISNPFNSDEARLCVENYGSYEQPTEKKN